jgi:hypothetical protein
MLYFFRFLLLLINIDQETVLNWFGIENPNNRNSLYQGVESDSNVNLSKIQIEPASDVSLDTLRLIIQGLLEKIQDGLTLSDIENILFFILSIRFIILAIRYNSKTSLYITCIGLVAGYLWYRHLIDLISIYRSLLVKLPFLHKLGSDAFQLRSLHRQMVLTDLELGENVHWYNPGQLIYHAFTKGIVNVDPKTKLEYYVDPISMIISNLQESNRFILPIYYKVYNTIIPTIYDICSKFWSQISGIAAYALITRVGKKYCPYLIRWHWTFLLMISIIEQFFTSFLYRVLYFQTYVLIPRTESLSNFGDPNLLLQINILNVIIACIVLAHIGFILFGLFHAIWGQYFYFPFLVENIELHVGPRVKNGFYSGGSTAWQNREEKTEKIFKRLLPKFWYGWFGRGTKDSRQLSNMFKRFIMTLFKKLKKKFKKLKKKFRK